MASFTLAEFVIESGSKARGTLRAALRVVGSELVGNKKQSRAAVKRYVLDAKAQNVLSHFNKIPFQEFADQFQHIVMPFDKIWIEDVPYPNILDVPGRVQRKGFLVKKQNGELRVRLVTEVMAQDSKLLSLQATCAFVDRIGGYIKDRRYLLTDDIEFVLSNKGLSVDFSAAVWAKMDLAADNAEADKQIAEDIFRLLVLISSRDVSSNMVASSVGSDVRGDPVGSLVPIEIDLTPKLKSALKVGNYKAVRKLLGWTEVSRHTRTYHTLSGPVVKTIEPYDRRIAAEVDRRGVSRTLTASSPDRPPALQRTPLLQPWNNDK